MSTGTERAPVRRRERGERRIEQIIDAAADVFVEKGYEGASTNVIAAHAGISPGSLYQFFRNKEEIAEALAKRYSAVFEEALDHAFLIEAASAPTTVMADRIVDTLIAVNLAHPALRTVFRGWDAPPALAAAIQPLTDGILMRVNALVLARQPSMAPEEARRIAMTTIGIFRGIIPLALMAPEPHRQAFAAELKRALVAYIDKVEAQVSSSAI